jgi:oligoribonuclease
VGVTRQGQLRVQLAHLHLDYVLADHCDQVTSVIGACLGPTALAPASAGLARGSAGPGPPYRVRTVLAWMDLEMTGLDPRRDKIVEIATLLTDDELEIVADGPDLVIAAPPEALDAMDDVVRQMHARSGLLDAIKTSTVTLQQAADETLAFVREHVPEAKKVPLCGNSIGTDRRFLAAYMPEVEDYLHYRSIDVSTVKELARRWYPEAFAAAPKKSGAHRALDDIKESVDELKYWRSTIFRERSSSA